MFIRFFIISLVLFCNGHDGQWYLQIFVSSQLNQVIRAINSECWWSFMFCYINSSIVPILIEYSFIPVLSTSENHKCLIINRLRFFMFNCTTFVPLALFSYSYKVILGNIMGTLIAKKSITFKCYAYRIVIFKT